MELREIGRSGLKIRPLVLGGNVFGWNIDKQASFDILDRFVAMGFNAVDTADLYSAWAPGNSGGESESIIGDWLQSRGSRDRIVLATKVGGTLPNMRSGSGRLSRAYIMGAVERSLDRLRTDYIDLYQSHLDDADTPIEETLEAYGRLIQSGKVRAIGASHFKPSRIREALDVSEERALPRYSSVQPRYNLLDRKEYEGPLQELCSQQGVGVLCYSALAKGFLSGKYLQKEDTGSSIWREQLKPYFSERGDRVLNELRRVAEQHKTTMAAVALAWIIGQNGVTAPIVAVSSLIELGEAAAAASIQLSSEDLEALSAGGYEI